VSDKTKELRVISKGVFDSLPTSHGSIRVLRGEECVFVIPIEGASEKATKVAIERAKLLASAVGRALARQVQGKVTEEERKLLREGKKLHAIKVHRTRTGASLRESKRIMDVAVGRLADQEAIVSDDDWDVWGEP
jgi:ribosomal protein L7/L12